MTHGNEGAKKLLSLLLSGAGDLLGRLESMERQLDDMKRVQQDAMRSRDGFGEWPVPELLRAAKSLAHPRQRYMYHQVAIEIMELRAKVKDLTDELENRECRRVRGSDRA